MNKPEMDRCDREIAEALQTISDAGEYVSAYTWLNDWQLEKQLIEQEGL